MPDDQAMEKQLILRCLGAVVHVVPNASIAHAGHYVNVARRIALDITSAQSGGDSSINERPPIQAAFMNQFENESNYQAHVQTTGPELWDQTNHQIDVFCMSSGTGATLSGVGRYLKDQSSKEMAVAGEAETIVGNSRRRPCQIILVDPPGSVLYNKVKYNVAYASEQRERNVLRHRYDTIAEGIGLDRITHNFALGVVEETNDRCRVIDDAIRVSDQEAVDMAHWLLRYEGLFVGSSSAMNVVGALQMAIRDDDDGNDDGNDDSINENTVGSSEVEGKKGACIVTVICDGGQRHLTRFWNPEFIRGAGLQWPGDDSVAWRMRLPSCLSSSL